MNLYDYADNLEEALETLGAKTRRYGRLFDYYDGDTPLVYSASRLREMFRGLDAHFAENWCAPVVDSLTDRLSLGGLALPDTGKAKAAAGALKQLWNGQAIDVLADDVAEDVAIAGESYVIVWHDAAGNVRIHHNDPRLVHLFADENGEPAWAAKWWKEDGKKRVTLYYPDGFAHFTSRGKAEADETRKPSGYELTGEESHEAGRPPVFRFRSRGRKIAGELQNACDIQDMLTKELADMMVSSEYAAFPQRWYIGNASAENMKAGPGTTARIPPGESGGQPAAVGSFPAADLAAYITVLDHFANAMASITRTPKPAFFQLGGNVSGDALVAMEAPLNKKAAKYQKRLGATWRDVAAFALKLAGVAVIADDVTPVWEEARTVQPVSEATAAASYTAAGVPLKTILRRQGWTADELAKMDVDKAEADAAQANLGDFLTRSFNQGDGAGTGFGQ